MCVESLGLVYSSGVTISPDGRTPRDLTGEWTDTGPNDGEGIYLGLDGAIRIEQQGRGYSGPTHEILESKSKKFERIAYENTYFDMFSDFGHLCVGADAS
jgi:hypothetical protein